MRLEEWMVKELEKMVERVVGKCTTEGGEVDEDCVDDELDELADEVRELTRACDPYILARMVYDYYRGEGGWDPGDIEVELLAPEVCVDDILEMAEKVSCYAWLVDAWWRIRAYYAQKGRKRG